MRKPRDINTELEALKLRTKALKARQVAQLGELVIATGADAVETDVLAGALLAAVGAAAGERAKWKAAGAEFFREGKRRSGANGSGQIESDRKGNATHQSGGAPA